MSATAEQGPTLLESKRLLIGEGAEEVIFFKALLSELKVGGVQVENYSGKSGLAAYLRALKTRPDFSKLEVLGITRDSDEDPQGAQASLDDALRKADLPAIIKIRPFLMPGAGQKGALENLCLNSITGQPIEKCIDTFFECANQATPRAWPGVALPAKARIHAWLATREKPDLRLGEAAKAGFIDWNSPAFNDIKQYLRELFG